MAAHVSAFVLSEDLFRFVAPGTVVSPVPIPRRLSSRILFTQEISALHLHVLVFRCRGEVQRLSVINNQAPNLACFYCRCVSCVCWFVLPALRLPPACTKHASSTGSRSRQAPVSSGRLVCCGIRSLVGRTRAAQRRVYPFTQH